MHQVSRPLGVIWSDLLSEPIFRIGIVIKVILIIFLIPEIQYEWFVPFIVNWIENPTILPWSGHLSSGGDSLAFPYGPIMFISHLPSTAIGWLFDQMFVVDYFANFGFRISLIGADVLLLLLLLQIFEKNWKGILKFYWLSPFVFFITYWHGQTDLIPVTLFIYSLTLIKRRYFRFAGLFLACSIATKHSMAIGVPFIILYLWTHDGFRSKFQHFLLVFISSLLLIEAPFLFSDAFRMMVLENREVDKLYWLFINMGKENLIYLTPIVYLLLLYSFWRIKRVNFDLLIAVMGVAFSVVILMTPSPPGWYLWLVPIFAIHQSRYGSGAVILIGFFSLIFITYHLIHTSGASSILFGSEIFQTTILQSMRVQSIHYTLMVGFGFLIAIQILRTGVRENDYYRLGYRPLALGISGDSGVGKSIFAKGLTDIFGERSTVKVSSNDYYNWDRFSPMWNIFTNLNPKANRLFQLVKDVRCLMNGGSIKTRTYNHMTGYFLPMVAKKSRSVILVTGPHALYPQQLLEEFDVSVFIEMNESLKLFMNMRTDVESQRSSGDAVLGEIEQRKIDAKQYIKPQAMRSNVVFELLPINSELVGKGINIGSNIKVRAYIKHGIYYDELVQVLIGVCALQVNVDSISEKGEVVIEVSGDIASEDVNLAVNILVPHMEELFDFSVEFAHGIQGIMQIITLMEIDEALKRRRVM
jgi:uridine kinase